MILPTQQRNRGNVMSLTNIGFSRLSILQHAAAICLLLSLETVSFAVGWSDDFNDGSVTDGSPFTWSQNVPQNYFPGTYDALLFGLPAVAFAPG